MDYHQLNSKRFSGQGYITTYNKYRPSPPKEIIHQTLNYLNSSTAKKLVDLGCGTGISTLVWNDFASKIIGVEPSVEMISIAKEYNSTDSIKYIQGYSDNINVESNSVDIVTSSQSFHWMEPKSTLKEIDRILKKDAVLLIYDVIWPPSTNYELEQAYNTLFEKINKITEDLNQEIAYKWQKDNHYTNIYNSGYFKFVKEAYYHKTEKFSKEQFVGIALSQGGLEALLKRGFSEKEIGLEDFKIKVSKVNDLKYDIITYNYKVIFAIK